MYCKIQTDCGFNHPCTDSPIWEKISLFLSDNGTVKIFHFLYFGQLEGEATAKNRVVGGIGTVNLSFMEKCPYCFPENTSVRV